MANHINKGYILWITSVSAMGGLLFGYDWVVIGGAKPFYERFFQITGDAHLQGWAMSSALIGCVLGALSVGIITDLFGRKKILSLAALIFLISAIGTGASNQLSSFIIFRILGGIGIGFASTVSPLYISEVSPKDYRGRLVSLNQLTIVIGILLAQIINYLIAEPVPNGFSDQQILLSWNGQIGWRWMFWAEATPAALFLISTFFIPESTRWLAKSGNYNRALKGLEKIGGHSYAESEIKNIKTTLVDRTDNIHPRELLQKPASKVLFIGIFLAVFQQWSGINVIFNYAEEIFVSAGYGISDILFNIILTGTVNLIFTFLAIYLVDRWGRKKLMITGALGLGLNYVLLGLTFHFEVGGFFVLLLIVMAIATYAMTLAPVTWVIISEIFPNRIRGVAMSIATFSLWSACFILTYSFPFLNRLLKTSGTFWLYGMICLFSFLLIKQFLSETMGKSLEDIEKDN